MAVLSLIKRSTRSQGQEVRPAIYGAQQVLEKALAAEGTSSEGHSETENVSRRGIVE